MLIGCLLKCPGLLHWYFYVTDAFSGSEIDVVVSGIVFVLISYCFYLMNWRSSLCFD